MQLGFGAKLGETVFAVGTPLRKEFANTVTRGIVSGTRLVDGQPLIQSYTRSWQFWRTAPGRTGQDLGLDRVGLHARRR